MIKLFQFSLGVILTLCLNVLYASSENPTSDYVDKFDWAMFMKYRMPLSLCTKKSPFIKCSNISQSQCKEFASKAVDECLTDNDKNIPKLLNKRESGDWGADIGDCTGRKLFNIIEFKEDKDSLCREYLQPVG